VTTEEYAYEERAAVLEYDAGMSRKDAERRAREMLAHDAAKGEQLGMFAESD
jgi:hypothetical protein